ncbi:DUF397 domain-containing protein [Prauserella rugosa]|uniref:Uncharacterized protein DUF397 n=1 Tax=Prauserella rugosa TaxID=43354 RepID=A0A660CNG8_9PSEU|nr:DUF397 domain-containing protein [Prauserella rugosa]KID31029.1 protein of unknown function (DUF397) [Prauserella sp. Am3]KMS92254.1 hypothetical protein ACZ91_05275 [Streptomyces regensis]TWH22811.1 uncharacterized protein DUF397 [Prauserella rugosa]
MTWGVESNGGKVALAAALDLASARWSRVQPEGGDLEYAFVPHSDGVTYVVLRYARPEGESRPVLVFTPSEWDAFLAGARDGEFDRPQD